MTEENVKNRLETAYPDSDIHVVDMTGGGSNFQVQIASKQFAGKTRIKQHQEVMAVFDEELKSGEMHAMTIKTTIKE